ncbi:MAG: orotidine-5'-phosphate decarboxylase [Spirochaetia bacterium]|nr:orotidine-5'-phosphate decarboxylase [Spirochaetia bacterium]
MTTSQKNNLDFLIIALDFPDSLSALNLVKELGDSVSFYKVGMQLFFSDGNHVIKSLKERKKKIFLDLKLNDIPETLYKTAKVLSSYSVEYLTLFSEKEGLEAAVKGFSEARSHTKILNVTKLTSAGNLDGNNEAIVNQVLYRAKMTSEAGAAGVICSGKETEAIRKSIPGDFTIINPGIRPAGSSLDDHQRTVTPSMALKAGASHIVVGRPVTMAKNPLAAVENIVLEYN